MAHQKRNIGIAEQIGNYSDAVEIPLDGRWLVTSGTPGLTADGTLPSGITAQAEQVWKNIFATLRAAGMEPSDLVKTTTYLTNAADVEAYGKVRAKYLGDIKPASMLMVVTGMVRPEFLVEVEAIAAKT